MKKILANPSNYVIGSMSQDEKTVLQIIKTPSNVRFFRNILTGCLISDYLVFTLDCSSLDRLGQNLQEYCAAHISKYLLKQIAFVLFNYSSSSLHDQENPGENLTSAKEQILSAIQKTLASLHINIVPKVVFFDPLEAQNSILAFVEEEVLRNIVEIDPFPSPVVWPS